MRECGPREGVKCVEADFGGPLPRSFPKGIVEKEIGDEASTPPLIDWDGNPAKTLGLADGDILQVFVIDKEGLLRFKVAGAYSGESERKVMEQVDKLR